MTVQTLVLEQVGPFAGEESLDTTRYRTCDFCGDTALSDIWSGELDQSKWRAFYSVHPGGEIACEHCVPLIDFP